ncbi:MAG: PrsW family intramembrane metalloprotease, partial [Mycobacterium sp.]
GLVYLLGRPAEPRRVVRGLALMLTAMVLHGAWDSTPALAGLTPLATLGFLVGLIVTALVVVAGVYHLTVTRERGFLRDVMAPEAARRVITADELRAMTGGRKARKAHRKAGRSRGERRRARYVLNAAYDLAGVLAASRGADTERVRFARFEVSRIRAGVAAPP